MNAQMPFTGNQHFLRFCCICFTCMCEPVGVCVFFSLNHLKVNCRHRDTSLLKTSAYFPTKQFENKCRHHHNILLDLPRMRPFLNTTTVPLVNLRKSTVISDIIQYPVWMQISPIVPRMYFSNQGFVKIYARHLVLMFL